MSVSQVDVYNAAKGINQTVLFSRKMTYLAIAAIALSCLGIYFEIKSALLWPVFVMAIYMLCLYITSGSMHGLLPDVDVDDAPIAKFFHILLSDAHKYGAKQVLFGHPIGAEPVEYITEPSEQCATTDEFMIDNKMSGTIEDTETLIFGEVIEDARRERDVITLSYFLPVSIVGDKAAISFKTAAGWKVMQPGVMSITLLPEIMLYIYQSLKIDPREVRTAKVRDIVNLGENGNKLSAKISLGLDEMSRYVIHINEWRM